MVLYLQCLVFNCILEAYVPLADWAFHHHKDFNDEVATEHLSAVVAVRFMPHDNPENPNNLGSINQRHCDRAVNQVT